MYAPNEPLPDAATGPRVHPAAWVLGPVAALGATFIGTAALLGWVTESDLLKGELREGMIVMVPNTALACLLAGTALLLLRWGRTPRAHAVAFAATVVVFLMGVLTYIERMTGVSLGIDLLLFADEVLTYPYLPPGQMASNSTVCLTLAGIGLLFLRKEPRVRPFVRELAACAGLAVSGLALLGYVYGAGTLYTFDRAAGMALVTALAFALLHVALLFARPADGAVGLISGRDLTGEVARPLLAAGILVPVVSGWLWLQAREDDVFSREGGMALLTITDFVLLLIVVLPSLRVLHRVDLRRRTLLERERELRATAEAARTEAEAANRVKTEFLATMSHELRTPLNAIIGYSSLMQEGLTGTLTVDQIQHVGRVKVSADHLLALIEQVLAMARLEAGNVQLAITATTARELAEGAAAIAEPLFTGKPVRFSVQVHDDGPLFTDADRVRQILLNLLSNAAKFTAAGDVRLTVGADARGLARFIVSDSGIGIAPEHQERIFEPFWQVERTHTRPFEGVGLGLSVSRELARRLGGDLTVVSRPGEGSTFCLSLPLDAAAVAATANRVPAGVPSAAPPPASPIPPVPDVYSAAPTSP
jgi:signal transduction histidine kinase